MKTCSVTLSAETSISSPFFEQIAYIWSEEPITSLFPPSGTRRRVVLPFYSRDKNHAVLVGSSYHAKVCRVTVVRCLVIDVCGDEISVITRGYHVSMLCQSVKGRDGSYSRMEMITWSFISTRGVELELQVELKNPFQVTNTGYVLCGMWGPPYVLCLESGAYLLPRWA